MIPLAPILNLLSPANHGARLSILIFHRVLPSPDPLFPGEPDAAWFDQMLGWLKEWFNVLPLDDALMRLTECRLPARAAAITFDDGYADNYHVALPLLQKHGLSATFFISTGYTDGGTMWNDVVIESVRNSKAQSLDLSHLQSFGNSQSSLFPLGTILEKSTTISAILPKIKHLPIAERKAAVKAISDQISTSLPSDMMMSSQQIIQMRKSGMLIGAHTVTHPILAKLDASEVHKEISDSKKYLEALLQEKINLFAYPNGKPNSDYRASDAAIIKELGFNAALSTAWGVVDDESDMMQLPRFTPWDRTKLRFGARLLKNLIQNKTMKSAQTAE
jgi:peptidoglycan/xylan/chitin deacetylase (PgdA/CDA1 family)